MPPTLVQPESACRTKPPMTRAILIERPALGRAMLIPRILVFGLALGLWARQGPAADWPRFRGPNGTGVSEAQGLPVEFGPKTNLLWKVDVPAGSSSPIASGERVWLTGFEGNRLLLLCIDRNSGQRLWERSVAEGRM